MDFDFEVLKTAAKSVQRHLSEYRNVNSMRAFVAIDYYNICLLLAYIYVQFGFA
jgi:hypothetical protein